MDLTSAYIGSPGARLIVLWLRTEAAARANATHASETDPDARLYRKANGQSSRLCYMGHLLMENANALIVDASRDLAVTPHIAVDGRLSKFGKPRSTRIDRRTTRHPGYAASQKLRKRSWAGSRPPAGWPRPGIAGSTGWAGCSHSPPPPTTWSGCPNCSPRRRPDAHQTRKARRSSPRAGRKPRSALPITREIRPNPPQIVSFSAAC